MNARIIKESRALLPTVLITAGATVAASAIFHTSSVFSGSAFVLGFCVSVLAASSVGNEFGNRTMALLLAQPLPRRRIWNEKMLVLGGALAVAWLAWLAGAATFNELRITSSDFINMAVILACVCVGVLGSAPWMALKVRNTYLGAVLAWGLPYALVLFAVLIGWIFLDKNFLGLGSLLREATRNFFIAHPVTNGSLLSRLIRFFYYLHPLFYLCAAVGAYSAFAFWRGQVAFGKLQAVDSRQGEISLPAGMDRALARPLGAILPGYRNPRASLIRKELGLQKPTYVLAATAVLLSVMEGIAQKLHPSDVLMGLLNVNFVLCVAICPLVATGLSVAEERNLGAAGWQSVLPVSPLRQWLVKLAVVIGTCLLLGVALPAAMFIAGQELHVITAGNPPKSFSDVLDSVSLVGCLVYFSLLAVGIYASSVSTATFRAIMLAMAYLAGISLAAMFAEWLELWVRHTLWARLIMDALPTIAPNNSVFILECAILLGLLIGPLIYRNFRKSDVNAGLIWRQAAIIFPALTVALTILMMLFR